MPDGGIPHQASFVDLFGCSSERSPTHTRQPRPFIFDLTQEEADVIRQPERRGGHQDFHSMIADQLRRGRTVTLDDASLGRLVRLMTQYGSVAV